MIGLGARSSAEEARTDSPGAGEDETIVEPEQNNGQSEESSCHDVRSKAQC